MSEMRDGFLVTEGRKKLWDVELQMMDFIEDICQKNGLDYFLIGGTAIGAVRHGGFIPWDDDIDIGMLRADFERFIKVFKSIDQHNYVMEYGYECEITSGTFMRIRDKRTTAIINQQFTVSKEHGVFIEVYPFDTVPADERARNKQMLESERLKLELNHRFIKSELGKRGSLRHIYYSLFSSEELWKRWKKICTQYNDLRSGLVDTPSLPFYVKQGINLYYLEDVASTEYVDFDGHKVRIAKGNDRCLKISYGDYMKLPPVEERSMEHSTVVFYDAFKPWREYMEKDKDVVERFFRGDYKLSNIW